MTRAKNFRKALNLIAAAAFAAALAIPALTHDAPLGGWTGLDANTETMPVNIPEWSATYADQFPGCTNVQAKTAGDVVTVNQRREVERVDFATAWEANQNTEHADDLYVVGWCA